MKKTILFLFILISSLTYAQTKELQQSIDSFRTVLNEQSIHIKQLQTQIRRLNTLVNTLKNDLNGVPEFSKVEKQQLNAIDSSLIVTKPKINRLRSNNNIVQSKEISSKLTPMRIKMLISKSRLIRISGDRKYYRDKFNRLFFVDKNNKVFYIR